MKLNVHNLVRWFQAEYPWLVTEMKEASHHYHDQDNINGYHIEGDVWTHTMMVVNQVRESKDHNLLVATLLHDIGKPQARKENPEKERVHFWGHEPLSMFLAIPIIDHISKDFRCTLSKRLILEAIAMHTDVYNVPREKLIVRLDGKPRLAKLLSDLSTADYDGRFYDNGERDMEPIVSELRLRRAQVMDTPNLVVMVGLPCSGKSMTCGVIKDTHVEYEILSRDEIVMTLCPGKTYDEAFKTVDQDEVNERFIERRKMLTSQGKNVILDMTNMGRKARRRNIQGFDGYFKTAEVVMTSLDNIYNRNNKREGKFIPDKVLDRMMTSFQPPLLDEFDDINWSFNG